MIKLLYEVRKNIKLILRNWSSLLVIILGPLALLALVGYALSGSDIQDITVGVVSPDGQIVSVLQKNLQDTATIIAYPTTQTCIEDMQRESVALCVAVKGSLLAPAGKQHPGGEFTFYYDNTRPKITFLLINAFKQQLGLTSNQISVTSAEIIINDINEFIGFLQARLNDLDQVDEQASLIQQDLQEHLMLLRQINESFTPNYLFVLEVEQKISSHNEDLELASALLQNSSAELAIASKIISEQLALLGPPVDQTTIDVLLGQILQYSQAVTASSQSSVSEIQEAINRVAQLRQQLDLINVALQTEITQTENYLVRIDEAKARIADTIGDAQTKMQALIQTDPDIAKKIVNPISQSFLPLVPNLESIHVVFPFLLATVILFMSMIVGNIVTLLEIHNKARTRNSLAPTSPLLYMVGIIVTGLLIISMQAAVLLILGKVTFGLALLPALPSVLFILFIFSWLFIMLGVIIAYLAPTIESSLLCSTILSLMFFLFSDALQAMQQMPPLAYLVAQYNPLVLVEFLLRKAIFLQTSVLQYPQELLVLAIYLLVCLGLVCWQACRVRG